MGLTPMPELKCVKVRRLVGVTLALVLILGSSGCLAVGIGTAAAGGAVGYAYYRGGVQRAYPVTIKAGSQATQDAMAKLGMPLTHATHREKESTLYFHQGQANGTRIRIWLEQESTPNPGDGVLTVITVRVGTFGDQELSERILAEIAKHLSLPVEPGAPAPGRLTPLAAEDPSLRATQPPSSLPPSLQNAQPISPQSYGAPQGAGTNPNPPSAEPPLALGNSAAPPGPPPAGPPPGQTVAPPLAVPGMIPSSPMALPATSDGREPGRLVPIPAGSPRP